MSEIATVQQPSAKSRYTIERTLYLAYRQNRRLRMKYETGYPLPGEPAIKFRNVDIYGIGDEYFEAYCHYRSEVRTFKTSRVLWAELGEETYSHSPSPTAPNVFGKTEHGTPNEVPCFSSKRLFS